MTRRAGNALVLTRRGPSYHAHVVLDGPWVHMTDCIVRHAAGGTPAHDKAHSHREISEVGWLDEPEPEPGRSDVLMGAEKRLVSVTAAQVTPETPRFAWEGRVPLAAVTVLAGPPSQGKTQLMLGACARATTGKLPGDLNGQPVDVLYLSAEDSLEHTLAPRFIAAGGDLQRLHFFRSIDTSSYHGDETRPGLLIPIDLPLLDQWLDEHPARLIVLDPIVAMIPTNLNTHRDQHVRSALAPLAHIAQQRSVAVVAIMHLNKNQEADALNRLSGSIGFGGAASSCSLPTPTILAAKTATNASSRT